jgi:ADP-ribose pyrophosphatase
MNNATNWVAKMKDSTLVTKEILLPTPKRFVREVLRMPDGNEIDWYYVDTPGSVMVVPVTEAGNVVLVRQYRHNLKADTLEAPAGIIHEGEEPCDAALRELQEETGHTVASRADLVPLGCFYSLPSETNKYTHVYLAWPSLHSGPAVGDAEIERYFDMSTVLLPFADAVASVGRVIHSMETVGALMLAQRHLTE